MGTRLLYAVCWAFLLSVGLAAALFPTGDDPLVVHGVGIVMAAVSTFFLIRSVRWTTIDVKPDMVVIRGVVNTWRLSVREIDRFVVVPVVNAEGEPSVALAVRLRAGPLQMFAEFLSSHNARGFSVAKLAEQLNERIGAVPKPR